MPWRYIGGLAAVFCLAVFCLALVFYTVGVALASPDQLFGWLNTLMATVLSVFSALVVGLVLFRFQTKEADLKKREELAALLEAELAELEREFKDSRTTVPDGILEDERSSAFHEIRLSIHHPHPLVIEEAIRSGLFDAQVTVGMLVLAREMRPTTSSWGKRPPWSPTWTGPSPPDSGADPVERSSSGCSGDTPRRSGWSSAPRRASSPAAGRCWKISEKYQSYDRS